MNKEIRDIFIELGYLGVSPITIYNLIKGFIDIKREDLESIKNCFSVREDGDRKYLFSEEPDKVFYIVDNEADLEILEIRKMAVWGMLVNSLESRNEELPF